MNNKYFSLEENFNKIIEKSLPEVNIKKVKFIPTGWTNIVYEVEAENENYFFRFPRDEFWSRTIVKDYQFAKYIHNKTKFNTIELQLLLDKGRPYSMHKKIPGVPLADRMNNLSEEQIDNVASQISNFMVEMHNLKFDYNAVFSTNDIGIELNDFLEELLTSHIEKENMIFWNKKLKCNEKKCLVHGDLNSSNILLDEKNNVSAIIDFGFGGFGNKYDDISRIIGRCPTNFKDKIISSYEKNSKEELNKEFLNENITRWTNIDNAYIGYMRRIGIYE